MRAAVSMRAEKMSLLVIAGGKSSRMGTDKRWLELAGCPLLERLLKKAAQEPFAEKLLCVEAVTEELLALARRYGFALLADERKNAGPMEGLRRGLQAVPTEYVLALSCDMPFFSFSAVRPLRAAVSAAAGLWAVLPLADGRRQPLAAIYHRKMAAEFSAALERGQHKIGAVLATVPHRLVPLARSACFFNANTPADMRLVRGRLANEMRDTPLVTVSAPVSNTGKTTFIEKLIPLLRERGVRTGVVKGDCHGYALDVRGKDSWRFSQAGAECVAVVSPEGYFLQQRTGGRESLLSVAAKLEHVDLVLIESRQHGALPKLSLWRDLGEPVVDEDTAALFTSRPLASRDVVQHDINDMETAVSLVQFLMGKDI